MIRVKTRLKLFPLMNLEMMAEIVEQIQNDMTSKAP